MAKVASILFLLAFGWYSVGFIMHTRLQVRAIKREMRASIRSGSFKANDVIEVTLVPEDFRTGEHAPQLVNDHEFQWNGMMYDVVGATWKQGSLVIHCIPDVQEKQLLAWFIHFIKDKAGHHKKFNTNIAFSFGHFGQASAIHLPIILTADRAPVNCRYLDFSASVFCAVAVPPPWLAA